MGYSCLVNYYGGKSKLARYYPPPMYPSIIEPFAGMAAYSLRHCEKDVTLYDLDERVVAIWTVMLTLPIDEILHYIPDEMHHRDRISSVLSSETPFGVEQIMRACANVGAFGDKATNDVVTPMGADAWHCVKPRLSYWHPRIQHWKIFQRSYDTIPSQFATWFVDPPYQSFVDGSKGSDYKYCNVNYESLGSWCQQLEGHVIACESQGADYLPFTSFKTLNGIDYYGARDTSEVMWERRG